MRELKFRAWYPAYNKMYYKLMVGELAPDAGTVPALLNRDGERVNLWGDNSEGTIMQYTGLKDINGVEIYESDLVRDIDGSIDVVEWVEDIDTDRDWQHCTGFLIDLRRSIYCKDSRLNVEIVGNLYEHPELLGDGQR